MDNATEDRTERTSVSTPPGLEVRRIPGKGRGVFATRAFRKGQIVERCPVIPVPGRDWRRLESTDLGNYPYDWDGEDGHACALVLGLGSLYNHSYGPNAWNRAREDLLAMDFIALRRIAPGEEITVNYNDEDTPEDDLWFDVED